MITIHIRFFAGHRDIVGCTTQEMQLEPGTTLGQVWQRLVTSYPRLTGYTGRLLYARNQQFAGPETLLADGDEVAFIPPVSGGSSFVPFLICVSPLDPAPLVAYVQTP
ncbi:MAG: MoaD/ThiS family protein, partial [Oscillochloris sp.]|nr:MoaD/ThiS family protein [Oscillochloris sp.]